MKNFIVFVVLCLVQLFSVLSLAQDVVPVVAPVVQQVDPMFIPPEWLMSALKWIALAIPGVGPALVLAAQWAGVLFTATTTLALGLIGALKALASVSQFAGAAAFAEKIQKFLDTSPLIYWLKYLSMLNAPKK